MHTTWASPWRRPTSKSLGSWAGVIFTKPVPFSGSAWWSPMMGITRSVNGSFTCRPIRWLRSGSDGCTATAVSPNMVSGRVVATVTCPSPSANG